MKVVCLYFPSPLPQDGLRALGESCLRLSSQVALRGSEAVFIETGASGLLYGEDSLRARLRVLGARFQGSSPPRLGWGADAGEALARARYGRDDGTMLSWPLESLECYASPFFEDPEISRHMAALVKALRDFGVHDLGAFMALPAGGWGERFGPNAAVLRERLEGRMPMGWPRFEPARRLQEAQDLRDVETQSTGVDDDALRFHLKRLCDRMAARLRGRALRAAGLALELRFERTRGRIDLAPWVLELKLSLPVAEPSQLRKLMQERLESEARRRPLPRPLESLGLTVLSTVPGFSPQRDAFDAHEEAVEARDGLLARLAQRLGESRVFHAELLQRHSPEQAWRRNAPRTQAAPGGPLPATAKPRVDATAGSGAMEAAVPPVPRPTRLVRRPLLLARNGDWLLYWGGSDKARRWRALDWLGPERIGGEWWLGLASDPHGVPKARDYWRVGTAEGVDLWVFCRQGEESRQGALWLQGWWA
jgi:hypothetical protein